MTQLHEDPTHSARLAATHEASHAIVATELGIDVVLVEISQCKSQVPWGFETTQDGAKRSVIVLQAGAAAECKLNEIPLTWTESGFGDRVLAIDRTEKFGLDPDDFSEIGRLLSNIAIWHRICRLADALLERRRIEFPELPGFLR